MEASGMEVTVAQNGKEAVDFLPLPKKVPVFAMTANAFI